MTRLCFDTSAFHRSKHPDVLADWQSAVNTDELAICDQVRLEILYSARSASDYRSIAQELNGYFSISMEGTFARALEVQKALGERAALHHRSVTIADLLIAAAAEIAGLIVWHYDEDFERIAAVTGQPVEWIAPRGSL